FVSSIHCDPAPGCTMNSLTASCETAAIRAVVIPGVPGVGWVNTHELPSNPIARSAICGPQFRPSTMTPIALFNVTRPPSFGRGKSVRNVPLGVPHTTMIDAPAASIVFAGTTHAPVRNPLGHSDHPLIFTGDAPVLVIST